MSQPDPQITPALPVCFVAYVGTLSWRSGDDVIESTFEVILSSREASRRYRTAISTELPDGLPRILREADAKLRSLRKEGHPDAGGLVIAADSSHARRIAALPRTDGGSRNLVSWLPRHSAPVCGRAYTHDGGTANASSSRHAIAAVRLGGGRDAH